MPKWLLLQGNQPTIESRKKGECQLGQRDGFSDTDIRKLNTLYQVWTNRNSPYIRFQPIETVIMYPMYKPIGRDLISDIFVGWPVKFCAKKFCQIIFVCFSDKNSF